MDSVKADLSAIDDLGKEIFRAKKVLIGRLAERGYQLLREEVPKVTTNLQQGVAPPDVDYENFRATLTVSARSARTTGGEATLHLKSGKTRTVKLRPRAEFNYAEAVAKGRPAIKPKRAKVLLIPVAGAPSGESYISAGDKIYIVRRSAKAVAANPYDERAAKRLEGEVENIGDAVLRKIFN